MENKKQIITFDDEDVSPALPPEPKPAETDYQKRMREYRERSGPNPFDPDLSDYYDGGYGGEG